MMMSSALTCSGWCQDLCSQSKGSYTNVLGMAIEYKRPGGGLLPSKRLLGMCRWMGSHFHNWIDYNRVTFLVELLEWGRTFSGFLG